MNTQDTRTAVEDAIKKAVPEIIVSRARFEKDGPLYDIDERPISLEDVLRAVDPGDGLMEVQSRSTGTVSLYWNVDNEVSISSVWHLGKPLSEQSDEVIEFLYSVLCNDKEV